MATLVADYGSDSSDGEDDNDSPETDAKTNATDSNKEIALIPADVILEQVVHGQCSSVFANPFLEAEKCHNDSLEKHVKMTNPKVLEQKHHKNLCYKFQKGKCTFGDKCKYFHPPNILTPVDALTDNATVTASKTLRNENEEEDADMNRPKKKRYGLKNTLEPPKGYIKMYNKQKKSL